MPRIRIPRDRNAPFVGRRFAKAVLKSHPSAAKRAELIVSEMISNAVRHEEGDSALELVIDEHDDLAHITLSTSAPVRLQQGQRREPPTDGFGLAIIDRLAERWGIKDGSSPHVWCEIALC